MKATIVKQFENNNSIFKISFDADKKLYEPNNLSSLDDALFYLIQAIEKNKSNTTIDAVLCLNRVEECIRILKTCERELNFIAFKE